MTSNFLAGERRWASARRTGMTVIGKVAVPKPLNLPSQRLENHGLDPNVEIVPKGSLGWGGRPSSASNPWGSTSQSPNGDGSASSPSQLSGRPSSAGSGSRPSTAGSDRALERTANAWGPSSRPASASGVIASNQSSATLRPHSAETRPSSSQLSRFAEPSSESSTAHAPIGSVEKAGIISTESDKFSLASGDFPTLGSSKDSSTKTSEPRDQGSHSRPSSASGKMGKAETSQADVHSGTFNSWNRDGPQNADDGIQSGPTKWHGEPQPYHNANIPPPQFDAWRGPSMNAPGGVWYRGPPAGPPYGAPVGPGGFPMEPFPYYCPQIPPPALANAQPAPMSGAGPRGHHHPKNGELYRPQMPDAFVHPGMPFRPGFYRGPMPYEGYYGPPMGYGNSNERENPFKGMSGPSVHNRYLAPNAPDSGHSHARAGRNGSTGKILSDHVETSSGDGSGQRKVLAKQHNEREGKEDTQIVEHMQIFNSSHSKKGGQSDVSRRREWGADLDNEEEMYSSGTTEGQNASFHSGNDQFGRDPERASAKPFQNMHNSVVDSGQINQQASPASTPGMPQASPAMQRSSAVTATARDSTSMQKIEILNVKVCGSDGRPDELHSLESNEQKLRSHAVDTFNDVSNKIGKVPITYEKVPALNTGAIPNERISGFGDRTSQLPFAPRRSDHVHGKSGDTIKARLHSPDNHGQEKKPVATELPAALASNTSSSSHVHASNIQSAAADVEFPSGNNGDSSTEIHDATDSLAQRTKMKEFAKQRAMQLQKEEEERIREQKAKALAKLEELNRRTQGGDALKTERVLDPTEQELEEQTCSDSSILGVKPVPTKPPSAQNFEDVTQLCVGTVPLGDKTAALAACFPSDRPKAVTLEPIISHGQSLAEKDNADAGDFKVVPQTSEGVSRHKKNSFKPKQNVQQLNNVRETSQADVTSKETNLVAPSEVPSSEESNLPGNPTVVAEGPAQLRRKGYKSIKKHKLDDAMPISSQPSVAVNEAKPIEACSENENFNNGQSDVDIYSSQGVVTGVGGVESSKQHSLHSEEVHGRVINHRKPQQSRRFPRNQQSNRPLDKFHGSDNVMWAPVRSQNKSELEITQQIVQELVSSAKGDNQGQSNSRSKRAEMERYVPKPVAKELAQHGKIQQPDMTSTGLASDGPAERVESGLGSSGIQETGSSASHNVSVDAREIKQGKAHGSWRQRGFAEAPSSGSSHSTSTTVKNTRALVGQNHSVRSEVVSEKLEGQVLRESNVPGDHNMSADTDVAVPALATSGRDQLTTGKVKRHSLKADKSLGSGNGKERNSSTGEAYRNRTDSDIRHGEKITVPKESRGFEERVSSQWQPKSHPPSNNSQRGGRFSSITDAGEMSGVVKKDPPSQSRSHVIPHVKEMNEKDFSQPDQSVSDCKNLDMVNTGHQVLRKERRIPISKGSPYSLNEVAVSSEESTNAMAADGQPKQQSSFDIKRSRNQNIHSGSGRESHTDWGQERQRHNGHYEYHPVGSHNNHKPEKIEDGSHNVGPRYKDRSQNQSKRGRGNIHGRQSSSVRVDASSG